MPSAIQETLQGKSQIGTMRRISRMSVSSRGTLSPDLFTNEEEANRIDDDYIKQIYKERIIDRKTAEEAMNSLLRDPSSGLTSDFSNLLNGVQKRGRDVFVDHLFNKYAPENTERVTEGEIQLKTGKTRKGLSVGNIYIIKDKRGIITARDKKTGRFTKLKKEFFKEF